MFTPKPPPQGRGPNAPSSPTSPTTPTAALKPTPPPPQSSKQNVTPKPPSQPAPSSSTTSHRPSSASPSYGRSRTNPGSRSNSRSNSARSRPRTATLSDNRIWERLTSTPLKRNSKDISCVYDDVKNCTFHPVVSPAAQSLQQPPFMQRVPGYIERFIELHNAEPKFSGNDASTTFTFKPHINHLVKLDQAVTNRGSFLSRLQNDIKQRADRKEQLQKSLLFSFQPQLSERTKKRMAKVATPFLQRLMEDIERRDANIRQNKRAGEAIPYTFTPDISLTASTEPPSFQNFIERMVTDIDEREGAYAQRNLDLSQPYKPTSPNDPPPTARSGRPKSAATRLAKHATD